MSVGVHWCLIPAPLCEAVVREVWAALRTYGASAETIADFDRNGWWPHLRYGTAVLAVRDVLTKQVGADTIWADPQIVVRLPDAPGTLRGDLHVDSEPAWALAEGLTYQQIYGVELTRRQKGKAGTFLRGQELNLDVGDVVAFDPDEQHSGSPNQTTEVRMALFFRSLK